MKARRVLREDFCDVSVGDTEDCRNQKGFRRCDECPKEVDLSCDLLYEDA